MPTFLPPKPYQASNMLQEDDYPAMVADIKVQVGTGGGGGTVPSPSTGDSGSSKDSITKVEVRSNIISFLPKMTSGMFLESPPSGTKLLSDQIIMFPVVELNSTEFRFIHCRGACHLSVSGKFDSNGIFHLPLKIRGFLRNYNRVDYHNISIVPYTYGEFPMIASLDSATCDLTAEHVDVVLQSLNHDLWGAKFVTKLDIILEAIISASPDVNGWGEAFPQ